MFGTNEINLSGSLTRAPELAYTPSGTAVLKFTLTGEETIVNSSGQVKQRLFYLPVKVLGSRAEDLALADLKMGAGLVVRGALSYSDWEDEKGKHSRLEIVGVTVFEAAESVLTGVNQARISGNLTRDAQLRHTSKGTPVLNLNLAINHTYRKGQQIIPQTHYVEVTLWGSLAELHSSLKCGAGVFIAGRLVNQAWKDQYSNQRRALKVEAVNLEVIKRHVKPTEARAIQAA
jgi:single-strand DNA-binding protein